MVYVVTPQPICYRQITLDELLSGQIIAPIKRGSTSGTRTYLLKELNINRKANFDCDKLVDCLRSFVNKYSGLLNTEDKHELYHTFYIPKRSRGYRRIDAPLPELMDCLRELKRIFEEEFGALQHTSAFAYVKKRSCVEAMKRHQANQSKWFAKFDLHDFFGSTTMEFVMTSLGNIFPFSEVVKDEEGKTLLEQALSLAFLDGGLPQGTPISPLITNLVMIPIDYELSNTLRKLENKFVYTRYADDFQISSKYNFKYKEVEDLICTVLKKHGATFELNRGKTRYGSSAGSNWNLGIMLNKDNELTIGHKEKRRFEDSLAYYAMDKKKGIAWDKSDVQVLHGKYNYYKMVEGDVIDKIVEHFSKKHEVDILSRIKEDLKG